MSRCQSEKEVVVREEKKGVGKGKVKKNGGDKALCVRLKRADLFRGRIAEHQNL